MTTRLIKVLIVEDSLTMAEFLKFIIESDSELTVIGCAANGEEALSFIKKEKPDVVTMDLVMPKMDGFEATRRIMQTMPIPILIISAHFKTDQLNKSFQALQAGALDILEKPMSPYDPCFQSMAKAIINSIKTLAGVKLITRHYGRLPSFSLLSNKTPLSSSTALIEGIGIGASLGGPQALTTILTQLPANFPVPIFIVQHISEGFTEGFVNWIKPYLKLTIELAQHQTKAQPGHVYVAPDHCHLEISDQKEMQLIHAPPEEGARPSISRLFRSMAHSYGPHGIGALLTGMGRDGVEDLLLMKKKGAITIAQDQASALVFGMPKEAALIGAAQYVLSLEQIAYALTFFVTSSR